MEQFINNPILIRIRSNLLHKIRTCTCVGNYKNSLGAIFDKDHEQNYSRVSITDEGQNYMTLLVEILKEKHHFLLQLQQIFAFNTTAISLKIRHSNFENK